MKMHKNSAQGVEHARRVVLKGGLLATVLAAASTFRFAEAVAAEPELGLFETLCDLVIPDTDTPGAVAAGVPAFLVMALQHGLEGADPAFDYAGWARGALGADFVNRTSEQQVEALSVIDQRAFDRATAGPDNAPWVVLKKLIVLGYYTSEIGGSVELRYVHQPGRWDADLPLQPGDRALSNDWTAVEFG